MCAQNALSRQAKLDWTLSKWQPASSAGMTTVVHEKEMTMNTYSEFSRGNDYYGG
jgi:hypothetical protein